MKLSEKIQALRTAREWSQGELAEKLEVSRQSVSKWETGQSVPDLDKILKIADLFGVSTDYLLRESETPPPAPEPQIVYVEREKTKEEKPREKPGLSAERIVSAVFLLTAAVTIFSFLGAGVIRADEAALFLIFALCGISVEVLVCRRHLWSTILWTAVGLLPFWVQLTVSGIDRGIEYLMIVIGLTAAAFGLFLTYRKKN